MSDTTQPPAETLADVRAAADFITDCAAYLGDCGMKAAIETALREAFARHRIAALTRRAGGDAIPAGEEWPVKWAGPLTVGNMIANLRTLPADMPIHSAYHLVREGKPARLFVKHPTVSRERVDGREIKTGDESVPYSAVIWSHGREPEIATPKPPAGGDAETKGWDHRYRSLAWGEVILDTDECRRDDGTWVTGICVGQKAPDPAYTSHRVYRRLIAPVGGDAGGLIAAFARIVRDEGPQNPESDWTDYARTRAAMRDAILKRLAALALPAPVVEGDIVIKAKALLAALEGEPEEVFAGEIGREVADLRRAVEAYK